MTPAPSTSAPRLLFLDALRGFALVMMVWNHTAREWQDRSMGWTWYYSVYMTMAVAAPTFLFLVGFSLSLSLARTSGDLGSTLKKYMVRGGRIILAGLLLNALVFFPKDPIWANGVLQTIGLGIIVAAPLGLLVNRPGARSLILALAAAIYVSFVWSFGFLSGWVVAHPSSSLVLFFEFPPWPWVAFVLFGLVLGSLWVDNADASSRDRYMERMALAGLLGVAWLFAWDWWAGTPNRFMFTRDFILNRHWTPRGATVAWAIGITFCLMALFYFLDQLRWLRMTWLVTFGRTALLLYFVHHLIVFNLVSDHWHLKFHSWWRFGVANLVLFALLLGLARSWMEVKRLVRQRYPSAAALLRA
jgi:uncharacterized membrane protein